VCTSADTVLGATTALSPLCPPPAWKPRIDQHQHRSSTTTRISIHISRGEISIAPSRTSRMSSLWTPRPSLVALRRFSARERVTDSPSGRRSRRQPSYLAYPVGATSAPKELDRAHRQGMINMRTHGSSKAIDVHQLVHRSKDLLGDRFTAGRRTRPRLGGVSVTSTAASDIAGPATLPT
jgi:hypothetical protein